MITLFGMPSPNVLKIFIMLEEVEADYKFQFVDVWKGEQYGEKIERLNPNRKVPIIVDERGPLGQSSTLFESGAILLYLAEKFGRFFPADASRYEVLQWLMVQISAIGPMFGQFNHFSRFANDDYGLSRYTAQMHNLYGVVNRRLEAVPYLGGQDYSVADIAAFPWFRTEARMYAKPDSFFRDHAEEFPHLWQWYDRVAARTRAQIGIAKYDSIKSSLPTATPDDLDRMFLRGQHLPAGLGSRAASRS